MHKDSSLKKVKEFIEGLGEKALFTSYEVVEKLSINRNNADVTLGRLCDLGFAQRVTRGVFSTPGASFSIKEIVEAKAKTFGRQVVQSPDDPFLFFSNSGSGTFGIDGKRVTVKRITGRRWLQLAHWR